MKYMEKPTVRDIVMDAVIVIAVGAQVYFFLDELTDGRFSRELSVKLVKARAQIKDVYEREREVRKRTGRVIWNAWGAVDKSVADPDDNGDTGEG